MTRQCLIVFEAFCHQAQKRSHSHRMDQTMFFNVNYVQPGIFCRQMQTQWLRNWAYRSTIGNSYSKWIFTFNELFSYTYNDQTNTRKLCEGLCSLRLLKVGLWNDGIINKIMSKICISSLLRYLLFFYLRNETYKYGPS